MNNKKRSARAATQTADTNNNLTNYNSKALLLSILHEGKKSRLELAKRMNMSDREVRDLIEELRNEGQPICSSSSKSGYWLGDPIDARRTIEEYRTRGIKCLKTAIAMELGLQRNGQVEVEDVLV